MQRAVHCDNCDKTYFPTGPRGKLYCIDCGAQVREVFSETLSDSDIRHFGPMIETPEPQEKPIESVTTKPKGDLITG